MTASEGADCKGLQHFMRIQVIGVCRYSLLVSGGFRDAPQDMRSRASYLFDEQRMALRFAWFSHVLLPSLRAQSDKDFRFVVLASKQMPKQWKTALRQAVRGIRAVEIEFAEPGKHHTVANEAMQRRFEPDADVIAQFRVDDDDAVARDYVARVRSDFSADLTPLYSRFGIVSSDYARGLILDVDGDEARLIQCFERTWNCGQTLYTRPGSTDLLFNFGHHRLHRHMPTVSYHDSLMFVRGRHGTNDSSFSIPKLDTESWDMNALRDRFGISVDDLRAALAKHAPRADRAPI